MEQQQKKRSWWGRNWKWVLPAGCLTPIVLCGGGLAIIFAVVFGAIKSSEVYSQALARAKGNAQVLTLLGEPIEPGFFVSGNISVNGSSGTADLAVPISGPKGSATLYATATKTAGKWEYSVLQVALKVTGDRIDLLGKQ